MKSKHLITLLICLVIIVSCKNTKEEIPVHYVENMPTFFNLHNDNWLPNKWIRQPENLILVHETFKSVGYNILLENLKSENPIIIHDIYINKNPKNLVDSLILTYKNPQKSTKYYTEFWKRRKIEKNDATVFMILKDIQNSMNSKNKLVNNVSNNSKVNDTLKALLNIEFGNKFLTKEKAIKDFEVLKDLGFHQSAYNLLYENAVYQDIKWNRDSLKGTLKVSNESQRRRPWFMDNTK